VQKSPILLCFAIFLSPANLSAQITSDIRLNQIGFYPQGPKLAVVAGYGGTPFYITDLAYQDTVFSGTLSSQEVWALSDEAVSRANFTALTMPGTFVLVLSGGGTSHRFQIAPHVSQSVATAALKGFYYQRASTRLLNEHAGSWARSAGHPDTSVIIHPSAATPERPAGSTIAAPGGWYDAGDYNKYIVNSGITTWTLLSTYEHFPHYCDLLDLGIPESGNSLPDILDEVLWNLRWMLAMQDPHDGGVYSKLTNPHFDGWVMPVNATEPRYVVQKSSAAALDLAAVAAQAARVFSAFSSALPGFADSCLQVSLMAWGWARANPSVVYDQSLINQQFSPAINTGEYGDRNLQDEFDWAAAELFVTTGADSFLATGNPLRSPTASVPSWPQVRTLGLSTLAHHRASLGGGFDTSGVVSRIRALADNLRFTSETSPYRVPIGGLQGDFVWGSNGVAANQGMVLLMAYELTGDSAYLGAAASALDYLLGRNATGYCFVTGFGTQSPLHPHHRPSEADGRQLPVPGLLAGGPNPGREDGVSTYPSTLPARCYTDDVDSYASNEIAINWNAPFVYLALGLEAVRSPAGPATGFLEEENTVPPGTYGVLQNYPNPFNPSTVIRFFLSVPSDVRLEVYDTLGALVATLAREHLPAGMHEREWIPASLSSGAYFCKLVEFPDQSRGASSAGRTVRMLLVR
jgi:endoglucanase